ncbi:MAG: PucR family transcriptional regulator [Streptococcus pyogenes]|nr:MAG: PucR family transcriptional regulator [Streptococcus pyogenes]
MQAQELFPEVVISAFPKSDADWLSLPQGDHYLNFPLAHLSAREHYLLTWLRKDQSELTPEPSAWYRYLMEGKGAVPLDLATYQWLHLEHQAPLTPSQSDALAHLLGQVAAVLHLSPHRTCFLWDGLASDDPFSLLRDILPTLESDFDMSFTFLLGNRWPKEKADQLPAYFAEESQLFSAYLKEQPPHQVLSFAQLMLWSLTHGLAFSHIRSHFAHLIQEDSFGAAMIETLWRQQGNLVQTAQALYIHRNSLQYRLEKFYQQSGLNLKLLDDLAFAHLLPTLS